MIEDMRKGILGGTFDPVHLGHMDVAAAARAALGLTQVTFVPSKTPPHRDTQPIASGSHRLAMVTMALSGVDTYLVDDVELRGEGPSYTSVTLKTMVHQGANPLELFFITGADAFAEIVTWHEYPALLDRSHFVVVSRPGHAASKLATRLPEVAPRIREVKTGTDITPRSDRTSVWIVEEKTRDISSSDIRSRVASTQPIDKLVAPAVEEYIKRHRLYSRKTIRHG